MEAHALKRAWSRFGLLESDIAAIVAKIQRGQGTLLQQQSLRVKVYHVVHGGNRNIAAVYDKQRKMLVTLMFADVFVRDEDLDPDLLTKAE